MILKIILKDFRNFQKKSIDLSARTTVIIGPNGSGKTNILESIYLLSTGKSFRALIEEEMINHKRQIARVRALLIDGELEVVLTRGILEIGNSQPQKVARKKLLINGVGKRLIDFAGSFKITLFSPDDLDLVTQSPSKRRKFLDMVISQIDREYRRASLSYEKGLRRRNKLLVAIREGNAKRSYLAFWDKLLVKNGDYIGAKRAEFISFANGLGPLNNQKFALEYYKSAISEARLAQYASEEVAAATTLVGPHRDDFCFKLDSQDLAKFGSRGEQRMGVLWLKLGELKFIEEKTNQKPTLLLDDIFSELDHKHRKVVTSTIGKQQTIITTADPHHVRDIKRMEKITLE